MSRLKRESFFCFCSVGQIKFGCIHILFVWNHSETTSSAGCQFTCLVHIRVRWFVFTSVQKVRIKGGNKFVDFFNKLNEPGVNMPLNSRIRHSYSWVYINFSSALYVAAGRHFNGNYVLYFFQKLR